MDKDPELGIPTSTLQTVNWTRIKRTRLTRKAQVDARKGSAQPRRGEKSKGVLDGETGSLLILLKDGERNAHHGIIGPEGILRGHLVHSPAFQQDHTS